MYTPALVATYVLGSTLVLNAGVEDGLEALTDRTCWMRASTPAEQLPPKREEPVPYREPFVAVLPPSDLARPLVKGTFSGDSPTKNYFGRSRASRRETWNRSLPWEKRKQFDTYAA